MLEHEDTVASAHETLLIGLDEEYRHTLVMAFKCLHVACAHAHCLNVSATRLVHVQRSDS